MNTSIRSRIVVSTVVLALSLAVGFLGTEVISSAVKYRNAYAKDNLLRLHVVANSDSPFDQELKLAVRDAVLRKSAELFVGVEDKGEALGVFLDNRDDIRSAAIEVVRSWGKDYDVTFDIGNFEFPEKSYGELTLPAGSYDALRVVIGNGAGRNWWCVLFPPLCLVDSKEGVDVVPLEKQKASLGQVSIQFRLKYAHTALDWGSRLMEMARQHLHIPRLMNELVPSEALAAQEWK